AAAYAKHAAGVDVTGAALPPKALVPTGAAVLVEGMKGETVRNLQADLEALGFTFAKGVDGRFGAETVANVRQFQADNDLTIDGKAGEKTAKAIAAALAKRPGTPPTPPAPQPANWVSAIVAIILSIL